MNCIMRCGGFMVNQNTDNIIAYMSFRVNSIKKWIRLFQRKEDWRKMINIFVLESNVIGASWLAFPGKLSLHNTMAAHTDNTDRIHTKKVEENSLGSEFFLQINSKVE